MFCFVLWVKRLVFLWLIIMIRFTLPYGYFRTCFGHGSRTDCAQEGQARCPTGASTVPMWGKHRAHFQTKTGHIYMGWNLCFILDLWTSPKGVLTDIVIRVGVVSPAFGRDTNQKKKHGCHGIDTDWSFTDFFDLYFVNDSWILFFDLV